MDREKREERGRERNSRRKGIGGNEMKKERQKSQRRMRNRVQMNMRERMRGEMREPPYKSE